LVANAKEMVYMATMGGATVLGLEKEIGSIEIGKNADLIIIDLMKPHLIPVYDIYSQIVFSMSGNDVETSIINGKIVMENRTIPNFNFTDLRLQMDELSQRIKNSELINRYNF
jgi:5-methylthioadenosine/S-adenosylhomocysteine deaminase